MFLARGAKGCRRTARITPSYAEGVLTRPRRVGAVKLLGQPRRLVRSSDPRGGVDHFLSGAPASMARLVPAASIVQGERLLRLRDVLAIVGVSRAHVFNLSKQQLLPRPFSLGSNCARWVQSEVQVWVGESIAAARPRYTSPRGQS